MCEALTAISEAVGPSFVMAELHKRAAANKNPKVGWRCREQGQREAVPRRERACWHCLASA